MNLRRSYLFFLLGILLVSLQAPALMAQEPFSAEGIPPGSDYVYRKQYDQVQEILAKPDIAAREQALKAFMGKLHADAKIRQYMESFFGQIVQAYRDAGQTAKADALAQEMTKLFPSSDGAIVQQFQAAFEGKDYAKAIQMGEKVRQKAPNDGQVLYMLVESYRNTNNDAKAAEFTPKLIDVLGPKKGINYVVWMANHNLQQNNADGASKYFAMALDAYPSGRPDGWDAARWNSIKATYYEMQAKQAWGREDFKGAIDAFTKMTQVDPKNDTAYLFIGLAHWKLQDLEKAESAFAKAVVLNKSNSAKARQYLEQIYKPRNNNSLDGMDQLLAEARQELNL